MKTNERASKYQRFSHEELLAGVFAVAMIAFAILFANSFLSRVQHLTEQYESLTGFEGDEPIVLAELNIFWRDVNSAFLMAFPYGVASFVALVLLLLMLYFQKNKLTQKMTALEKELESLRPSK